MNQEIKTLWLEALRSGQYEQGKYCLRTEDNKFCCLGVLCDVYAKQHNVEWEVSETVGLEGKRVYTFFYQTGFLPKVVFEWAELDSHVGAVGSKTGMLVNLSALNDKGKTFHEIADIIEKEF